MTGLVRLHDARLKPLALSPSPAWLWSLEATRVLWANPPGAAVLGAPTPAALSVRPFEPADHAAAEVARLAQSLPEDGTPLVERLDGFGTGMGRPLTCSCACITLADGARAVLIAAIESGGPDLPLRERASRLLAACVEPVAVFDDDGVIIAATPQARRWIGDRTSLAALGVSALAATASNHGYATSDFANGTIAIARIRDPAAWIATFGPDVGQRAATIETASPAEPREQSYDQPYQRPYIVQPELFPELAPVTPALPAQDRRYPLRFVWQMDSDGRFTIDSDEFIALAGPRTAALMGQSWPFIASVMMLDPEGEVAHAVATRATWSGVTVAWRIDDSDERLAVELAGLPMFDRERRFGGYRGFGVCRDIARLNAIARMRRVGTSMTPAPADAPSAVLPPEADAPGLTPVEQYAFFELSRQLTRRINEADAQARWAVNTNEPGGMQAPSAADTSDAEPVIADQTRPFLERLPIGVLIYRLSDLLYANKAFLDWAGSDSLNALAEAGGLDSLTIESDDVAIEEGGGKSFSITGLKDENAVAEARLLQVPWDGDTAFVLLTMPPDVALWKKTEEDLIAARRDVERASSAKSDFLTKLRQDIHTPLEAIIASSEVMMEGRFGPIGDERYRQHLKDIHTSGTQLVSLINDALDLSNIEAGKLELAFASVSLNELTQQCVAIMQPQAHRERVIIRTSLSPRPPHVMADAGSVRQIVRNLLSNSIKVAGAGGQVIVSTAIADTGEVVLRVRDTGTGMSESELATAFEPFGQSTTATRARTSGIGFGLPLTKALAEANHATFQIKSAPNEGTLVEITFPGVGLLAAQ
jgi:signal transduction histidine kinase